MQIEGVEHDAAPTWIWRCSEYGKLGIDECQLLGQVLDRDRVPVEMAECFRLNLEVLLRQVKELPWGPQLWNRVYDFAEQIADLCATRPRSQAMH